MISVVSLSLLALTYVLYKLYRHRNRVVAKLPGPTPPSWLVGKQLPPTIRAAPDSYFQDHLENGRILLR